MGPFSNTTTCQPACASTIAANAPPAPLPITIAVRIGAPHTVPRNFSVSATTPVAGAGSGPSDRETSSGG